VERQQILAADVNDDALADLVALAVVLHQAERITAERWDQEAKSVSLQNSKNADPPPCFQ